MAWALKLPLADEVIESGLVQDFDASLSGIGQELGAGAYSMRYRGPQNIPGTPKHPGEPRELAGAVRGVGNPEMSWRLKVSGGTSAPVPAAGGDPGISRGTPKSPWVPRIPKGNPTVSGGPQNIHGGSQIPREEPKIS